MAIFAKRSVAPQVAFLVLAALAVAPVLNAAGLVFIRNQLGFGDWPTASVAYLNSLCLALVVSSISVTLSLYLVFARRKIGEMAILVIIGFLLPGDFLAIGMNRVIALATNRASNDLLQGVALVSSLIGFVIPYVGVSTLLVFLSIGRDRLEALAEITPSNISRGVLLGKAYWMPLLSTWLVGVNFSLTEVSRTRDLGCNLFGLGYQFFGPLVYDAYISTGLQGIYFFLAFASIVPVFVFLAVTIGRGRLGLLSKPA